MRRLILFVVFFDLSVLAFLGCFQNRQVREPHVLGISGSPMQDVESREVNAMLKDWYDAAERGDGPRYFRHFTGDAVFLGTDPTERWPLPEFRARFEQRFDGHHAWTYKSTERYVIFSSDHRIAWFDERLQSPKFGQLRGTGVVVKANDTWKIKHYSLTFVIPNEIVQNLAEHQNCRPVWTARCEELVQH